MIAQNYQKVTEKMRDASAQCQKQEPELLAVSKKKPATDIETLYRLGQRHFGESYAQEGVSKIEQLVDLKDIVWHFIGPMQSNKTRLVAAHFDWVQSVDREKILLRLNEHRSVDLKPLQVLLQMKIGDEETKSGADGTTLLHLLELGLELPQIQIRGLMCIPPFAESEEMQRHYFEQAHSFYLEYQSRFALDTLSMGMSNDYAVAIACGSTMIRIGTDLFGVRK